MTFAIYMLVGMILDALLGWPQGLYRRIGHPVTWLGAMITRLEGRLNKGARRARLAAGAVTTCLVVFVAIAVYWTLQLSLPDGLTGLLIGGVFAWPLIAMRSMRDHVIAVARPLSAGDMDAARQAVAMIVGRDPAQLDEAGIARAAIESLAENTSDGIIAPLFWGALFGLPGIAAYKAANTLDSMIGHRDARYEAFGKVAARLDDLVNWVPARLTALLFAAASFLRVVQAIRVMRRDAGKHRSPNAGWPESAMAGGLGVRLSGPRVYGTHQTDEPWLNAGARDPGADEIRLALRLYWWTMWLVGLALLGLALL